MTDIIDKVEMIDQLRKLSKDPVAVGVSVGITAFCMGAMAGISWVRRNELRTTRQDAQHWRRRYMDVRQELARVRLGREAVEQEFNKPLVVSEQTLLRKEVRERIAQDPERTTKAIEMAQELHPSIETEADAEVVRQRVLGSLGYRDDWDYEVETEVRKNIDGPYVIHAEEYEDNEGGFPQEVLTWYEGDRILATEAGEPIHNDQEVVGDLRFGHGSGDPNVCYVRNPDRCMEYEVLRHSGFYAVEVMGEDPRAPE